MIHREARLVGTRKTRSVRSGLSGAQSRRLSIRVRDNPPTDLVSGRDRFPLIKISPFIPGAFRDRSHKDMEMPVAGNRAIDRAAYACTRDGASNGSSAFHARVIDAMFFALARVAESFVRARGIVPKYRGPPRSENRKRESAFAGACYILERSTLVSLYRDH